MGGGSDLGTWDQRISGETCPLCTTRREDTNAYHDKIADLSVSTLYLQRNQTYRGYCVLIFNPRHATGLEWLTADEYAAFTGDLRRAALAISAVAEPDMMNYATLGNVIPHLHYHIMPRYQTDPRWGTPIWESNLADMQVTTLDDADFAQLRDAVKAALAA